MKIWKRTFWFLTILPFPFIITMLSYYFHSHYFLEDPSTHIDLGQNSMSISVFYASLIKPTISIWIISVWLWLGVVVSYLIVNRKNIQWKPVLISSIGHLIAYSIVFSDIFRWYVD